MRRRGRREFHQRIFSIDGRVVNGLSARWGLLHWAHPKHSKSRCGVLAMRLAIGRGLLNTSLHQHQKSSILPKMERAKFRRLVKLISSAAEQLLTAHCTRCLGCPSSMVQPELSSMTL